MERRGNAPEKCQEPLTRVHTTLDALPQHVQEDAGKEFLDEAVELEEAELKAGHVGGVVGAEVVGFHQPDEDAEGFFVGHLWERWSSALLASSGRISRCR